jgi:DNA-binding transcriptional LysR family regulator
MARPSLQDLQAFSAISEHRSFSRAADALGVSRSFLNHTLRVLERDLGVRLLNRTTRSVASADAGERLLQRLAPVLRDLDQALDAVADDGITNYGDTPVFAHLTARNAPRRRALAEPIFQTAAAVKDRLRRPPAAARRRGRAQNARSCERAVGRVLDSRSGLEVPQPRARRRGAFRSRRFSRPPANAEARRRSSAVADVFPPRPRRRSSTRRAGARFGVRCDAESLGDDRAATTTLSAVEPR